MSELREYRCEHCRRLRPQYRPHLLFKANLPPGGEVEIPCKQCGEMNRIVVSEQRVKAAPDGQGGYILTPVH